MNNRKILAVLLGLMVPHQLFCMAGVEPAHPALHQPPDFEDIQLRLNNAAGHIRECQDRITNNRAAWKRDWNFASAFLSSVPFLYFAGKKVGLFHKASDSVGNSTGWIRGTISSAIVGSIAYFVTRAMQRTWIGKASPRYIAVRNAKAELIQLQNDRNDIYEQTHRQYRDEHAALRQERQRLADGHANSERQTQTSQAETAQLRHDLRAAQDEAHAMHARADRLQVVVDRVQQDHPDLIPHEPQCPLCLEEMADPIRLACGHSYCRACLRQQFNVDMNERVIAHLHCTAPDCNHAFTPEEIGAIVANDPNHAQIFNHYLEVAARATGIALIPQENRVQCPGHNCASVFNWDGDRHNPHPMHCDACNTDFCANCRTLWGAHVNDRDEFPLPCEVAARNDRLAREAAKPDDVRKAEAADQKYIEQNTIACPFCGNREQRESGCNHMRCGGNAHEVAHPGHGCNREFCWLCLAPWPCPNGCPLFGGVPRRPGQGNAPAQ